MKNNDTLTEQEVYDKLDEMGIKALKVADKAFEKSKPKLFKLLRLIDKWLDKKLEV